MGQLDVLWTALLTIGAVARVTRLITKDRFPFGPVRDWALTRYGEHGWLPELIHCPWCTGVWVSAPATLSAYLWGDQLWWQVAAAWMALSMAASSWVVLTHHETPEVVLVDHDTTDDGTDSGGAGGSAPAAH